MSNTSSERYVWHVNGHEFPLDLQDASVSERCEKAFLAMSEREKAIPKDGLNSARIRARCDLFRSLFDDLFGEGAGQKIFGDEYNARTATEVYEKFLDFMANQRNGLLEVENRVMNRYSQNRAQRRAAGK